MSEPESCPRCRRPLDGAGVRLKLEPPAGLAGATELVLCDRCRESFERWLARRGRGRSRPSEPDGPREGRGAGTRRRPRRTPYADALDREESWLRARTALVVAATVAGTALGVGAVVGAYAYLIGFR